MRTFRSWSWGDIRGSSADSWWRRPTDPLPRSTSGRFSQRIATQSEEEFVATGYQEILDTVPGWAWMLRLCDPRAVHRSAVGLITGTRPTMREMLLAARIPRTFIRGEQGEPLVDAEGLQTAGVRVVTIPDAGHMMMADQPEAFVAAVASALDGGAANDGASEAVSALR
jgi:pimeloyl-ACP methyl ester carboxylesterase